MIMAVSEMRKGQEQSTHEMIAQTLNNLVSLQYGIRSKTRVFIVSFVRMPSSKRFCTKCMPIMSYVPVEQVIRFYEEQI